MPESGKRNARRPDQTGTHRTVFERNKKRIYATQNICGICGQPVDKTLKFPDPMSPCIDHIIPIAKGGHPSDIENMQLAHYFCNRQKSDKLLTPAPSENPGGDAAGGAKPANPLPLHFDWTNYRADGEN